MEQQVKKAIHILKKGGIVAYPTDTVYGLGANALDEAAVRRVFAAKRRPHHLAIPILLASISQIDEVARDIPITAWRLAERFLPGGLTLVLYKSPAIPDAVTAGDNKIAVRVPAHPIPIALIEGIGDPITGTSANLSGNPNPVTAEEVRLQLGEHVDLIIDGGRCQGEVASTVIDLTGEHPMILREGIVSREEIEKVCKLPAKCGKEVE
jgi:L-threonylcarbamoyladenylate synthase